MITWDDVLALGRELPETEESTSYGRPSLKVRGKSFVTIRERPDALVVRCAHGPEKARRGIRSRILRLRRPTCARMSSSMTDGAGIQ